MELMELKKKRKKDIEHFLTRDERTEIDIKEYDD